MRLTGAAAYENAVRADNPRWPEAIARFGADPLAIAHRPKFRLSPDDRVFCIGSCFARNVEETLIARGVDVLSKTIVSPRAEFPNRPNGLVNKFTTPSMANEMRWALARDGDGLGSLVESERGVVDLQLIPNAPPVPRERARARRLYLESDYFARIAEADVLLVTLGLVEAWRDEVLGLWLNAAPPFHAVRREPERYVLHVTGVAENLAALERMRALLHSANPNARLIVTVSPVPMSVTFSGADVFVANSLSKSVLRAAAHAFSVAHEDVDYFPSFEMVTGCSRPFAYGPDCVHVRHRVVEHVIGMFVDLYLPDLPRAPEGFVELLYLEANADVAEAVRRGELRSGYDHWRACGAAQGRPLRPAEIPPVLYRLGVLDPPEAQRSDGYAAPLSAAYPPGSDAAAPVISSSINAAATAPAGASSKRARSLT